MVEAVGTAVRPFSSRDLAISVSEGSPPPRWPRKMSASWNRFRRMNSLSYASCLGLALPRLRDRGPVSWDCSGMSWTNRMAWSC